MLSRRLAREGHRVQVVANGPEALTLLHRQPIDLVLLDVLMPEMSGYEVLQRLTADEALREIPVVMISALDEMDSVVRCIELGAEDYLPKPFDPVLLRARISACLEKKDLRDRERAFARDVKRVVSAAVDVERGTYSGGSLQDISLRGDELGTLARVFEGMVAGIR